MIRYDDVLGDLVTATGGGATWTNRYLRGSSGFPAYPHIATGDIFAMTFQMPHRKLLNAPVKSIHLHYVPAGTSGGTGTPTFGDMKLSVKWGWYNLGDEITGTDLPNDVGTVTIPVPAENFFRMRISNLVADLTPPTNEGYSSILMVRCERLTTGNVYTGDFALVYMDAHVPVDRTGSIYEYGDLPPGTLPA